MLADRKALTIVTAFLGMVMVGFWIAHACALYRGQEPTPAPETQIQTHLGMLSAKIGGVLR